MTFLQDMANNLGAIWFLGAFLVLLGIGGIFADYVLPRIPWLNRFVNNLPMLARYKAPAMPTVGNYTVRTPFLGFGPEGELHLDRVYPDGTVRIIGLDANGDYFPLHVPGGTILSHCDKIQEV